MLRQTNSRTAPQYARGGCCHRPGPGSSPEFHVERLGVGIARVVRTLEDALQTGAVPFDGVHDVGQRG